MLVDNYKNNPNVRRVVNEGREYFVVRHACPNCAWNLFTCSCESFKFSNSGGPLKECKHIVEAKSAFIGKEESLST